MLKRVIVRLIKGSAFPYLSIVLGLMLTAADASAAAYGVGPLPPRYYPAADQGSFGWPGERGNYSASAAEGGRAYRPAAPDWSSPPVKYRFRSMPGLPTTADYLPKFRPDQNAGRQPSNWHRDGSYWQSQAGGRPPVFRPIVNQREGRKGSARQQPVWSSVPDSPLTNGEFSPNWMGFGPSPAE